MLVIHDSRVTVSKENLVKKKFPYINKFDNEVPGVISAMRDLTVGMFEYL